MLILELGMKGGGWTAPCPSSFLLHRKGPPSTNTVREWEGPRPSMDGLWKKQSTFLAKGLIFQFSSLSPNHYTNYDVLVPCKKINFEFTKLFPFV